MDKITGILERPSIKFFLIPLLYILCIFSKGTHNTDDFTNWISGFIDGNFFSLYHVIPHKGILPSDSLMVPYPPFSLYILGIVGKILTLALGNSHTVLLVASNLTSVIFTFLTAALVSSFTKSGEARPAIYYVLNPAVFLVSPVLGYQDSIMSFFILASLILAEKKNYLSAGLCASLAVFAKQLAVMPMFGAAVLIILTFNWRIILRVFSGFLLGSIAVLSPFLVTGTISAYFRAQGLASVHTMMSAQNPNFPWLLSLIVRFFKFGLIDSKTYSALPYRIENDGTRQFLYIFFGALSILVVLFWLLHWIKELGIGNISFFYVGAISISAYNLFSFGVHENHFFMAIPILFVLARSPNSRKIYLWASGALFLNLLATGGLGRSITFIEPLTQASGILYALTSALCFSMYVLAMWNLARQNPKNWA